MEPAIPLCPPGTALPSVGLVAVMIFAGLSQGLAMDSAVVWLLVAALVGSIALIWRAPAATMCAPVACATSAGFMLGVSRAVLPSIMIAVVACILPSIRTSTWLPRATLLCAAGAGAVAMCVFLGALPPDFAASWWSALSVGVASGLAALLGWHGVMAGALAARSGRADVRTALGNAASDVRGFVLAGSIGGLSGWVMLHSGILASVAVLAVGAAVAVLVTRPTNGTAPELCLADDDLLDVLQSRAA